MNVYKFKKKKFIEKELKPHYINRTLSELEKGYQIV